MPWRQVPSGTWGEAAVIVVSVGLPWSGDSFSVPMLQVNPKP